ncbi:MAG TPA: hypothetical protein VHY32_07185 [Caulobacteraceae bacterium]|jgi:hypothetical protein|nr:hypothetical protein [Caulobacteraceae bacterium]
MIFCAAAALVALDAAPALAQSAPAAAPGGDVVATAPAKSNTQADTDAQISEWIKGAPLGISGDDDGVISATPDRGIHGEAGAFVSNRGYGGYVAATAPVGKDATVGLAVSDEHYSGRYYRGDARSLGASLAIGPQAQARRPAQCPAGVQVGGRYVQPVWVNQMRTAAPPDDLGDCFTPTAATAR